jgi:hypothetical protein
VRGERRAAFLPDRRSVVRRGPSSHITTCAHSSPRAPVAVAVSPSSIPFRLRPRCLHRIPFLDFSSPAQGGEFSFPFGSGVWSLDRPESWSQNWGFCRIESDATRVGSWRRNSSTERTRARPLLDRGKRRISGDALGGYRVDHFALPIAVWHAATYALFFSQFGIALSFLSSSPVHVCTKEDKRMLTWLSDLRVFFYYVRPSHTLLVFINITIVQI